MAIFRFYLKGCPGRNQRSLLHYASGWFLAVEDIRDIRGPIHIPYPWLWMVYVLAAIGILYALWKIYRYWKNRKKPDIIKLPHEIAFERLEAARLLMNSEKVREFSIAVSDAIRRYIEDRFQVAAAHRTTEEFLYHLMRDASSPLTPYSASLDDFLKHCDLAKFARWDLSSEEMQSMYESARKLVQGTIPLPTKVK